MERCPILRTDNALDCLGHAAIFTKINLGGGYHQVEIHPDRGYHAVYQMHFDLFE